MDIICLYQNPQKSFIKEFIEMKINPNCINCSYDPTNNPKCKNYFCFKGTEKEKENLLEIYANEYFAYQKNTKP
jgi:hypothetical protein